MDDGPHESRCQTDQHGPGIAYMARGGSHFEKDGKVVMSGDGELAIHSLGEETYSMAHTTSLLIAIITLLLVACGSLGMRSDLIGIGDDEEHVLNIMGPPIDRQRKGSHEAWQYCQTTGAGFGYHDYRIIWLYKGKVTGITSHTSSRGGSSCVMDIRSIRWEEAP